MGWRERTSDILLGRVMITEYPLTNVFSAQSPDRLMAETYLDGASHSQPYTCAVCWSSVPPPPARKRGQAREHTCVSRRRLDHDALAGYQLSLSLRCLHHGFRNAVLDRPTGGHVLHLSHCTERRKTGIVSQLVFFFPNHPGGTYINCI